MNPIWLTAAAWRVVPERDSKALLGDSRKLLDFDMSNLSIK